MFSSYVRKPCNFVLSSTYKLISTAVGYQVKTIKKVIMSSFDSNVGLAKVITTIKTGTGSTETLVKE